MRALACAAALLTLAGATVAASGATSTVVVTMDVPSATTLVTTGCAPGDAGVTDFGTVQPGAVVATSDDCAVTFGSSNDSASLRLAQSDGTGTAMARPTDTWTRQTGNSSRLSQVTSGHGMVLSLHTTGSVRRSTDNGATWTNGVASGLHQDGTMSIGSPTTAWGTTAAATVRRSTNINAGMTFAATAANPGMSATYGVAAASASEAWVVGSGGAIARTTDSGGSWITFASGVATALRAVHRLDADSLIAWGDGGSIVQTVDGTTWREISPPIMTTRVYGAWALTDDTVIAITARNIWRTTNATAATPTWTNADTGSHLNIRAIVFDSGTSGYIAGTDGVMFRTTNAGVSWTESDVDVAHSVNAMTSPAAGTVVAATFGNSHLVTTDSGVTWSIGTVADLPVTHNWLAVDSATDNWVWRVGSGGNIQRLPLSNLATGAVSQNASGPDLFGVHAFSDQRVTAVGRDGTILTTSNGGSTWTARTSGTTEDLYGVTGLPSGFGWAVGDNGTVLRTTDFGVTWSEVAHTPGDALVTVAAVDETHAVAFGDDGVATRTTDGVTWAGFALPTGALAVRTSTVQHGASTIAYVSSNSFVQSTDGGATWSIVGGATSMGIKGLAWPSAMRLWGTTDGAMYTSTDGGVTWNTVAVGTIQGHWGNGATVTDRATTLIVGDTNMIASTGIADAIADYQQGVSDWYADGTEAFGACLRATTANATWTPNGTCDQSADGAHWQGVSATTGTGSEVASTDAGDGIQTASLRFGLRVEPTQPPGEVSAGLTFLVIAPDV